MRRITAVLLVGLLLAACGQKGALYLPEDEDESARAVPDAGAAPHQEAA